MASGHRCPRRNEDPELDARFPGLDTYDMHSGMVNSFAPGCSYCGSISGDEFMDYVRAKEHVEGTDKNYEVYVSRHSGIAYQPETYDAYTQDDGTVVTATRAKSGTGRLTAKFYYCHLTQGQQLEFIALLNAGVVNHSIYVMPYFARQ